MAYRDPATLNLDRDLTNISAGFEAQTDLYISSKLAPPVRVDQDSGKYKVYDRSSWGRVTDDLRAPGSRANEIPPMTISRDTFTVHEHALVDVVPVEQSRKDPDAMSAATERVTNTILLNRERAFISKATTAANYASGFTVTLSGTDQWDDYTNSDPIGDLRAGQAAIHAAMFRMPNVVVMGWKVWRTLEEHPAVLDRIKSGLAIGTRAAISQVLGLPETIYVSEAGWVNADWGAAEATDYMWSDDVLLAYVPDSPGQNMPAFMYEFVRPVASASGEIMPTERVYDWDRKANKVRVSREYDFKFITVDSTGDSAGAAYLIKNVLST